MVESAEWNQKYTLIEVGLTNGLIGHRVLIIPEGNDFLYSYVSDLDDFRNLNFVNGVGATWFGARVWEQNGLQTYRHEGDYTLLFRMVARKNRGIDYFATGFNEVALELDKFSHLGLELESKLLFIYDRDYIFYLSKTYSEYKTVLESALNQAKESGLIDHMVREYWADSFELYDFDGRKKIHLYTPE